MPTFQPPCGSEREFAHAVNGSKARTHVRFYISRMVTRVKSSAVTRLQIFSESNSRAAPNRSSQTVMTLRNASAWVRRWPGRKRRDGDSSSAVRSRRTDTCCANAQMTILHPRHGKLLWHIAGRRPFLHRVHEQSVGLPIT